MKTIASLLVLILTISASVAQTDAQSSKETQSPNTLPAINFHSIDLRTALLTYADLTGRTVLQHPQLPKVKFSLTSNAQTKEEKAEAFETMFREQKIATIPDGDHFVMIVPFAFTNAVTPKAPAVANTNSLIPASSMNFQNVPVELTIQTCADFLGKKIEDIPAAMKQNNILGNVAITFTQTTPLSKQEICYALETQLAWNNIRLVPEGADNLKLERIAK